MTNREKIESMKDVISHMYEDEGRGKSEIARSLMLDRRLLSIIINKEWCFAQGQSRKRPKPSTQKFLNRWEDHIVKELNNDIPWTEIRKELKCSEYFLSTLKANSGKIREALAAKASRQHANVERRKLRNRRTVCSSRDGELWKPVLGASRYEVSNMGRVRTYYKTKDYFAEIKADVNPVSGYLQIHLALDTGKQKTYRLHRLVAKAWVEGWSENRDIVNHIDGNRLNNAASNLEWVSISENARHAYDKLNSQRSRPYKRNGQFTKIILDEKYEFKTIKALARFLGKSETQTQRYISGETPSPHTFKFIYN